MLCYVGHTASSSVTIRVKPGYSRFPLASFTPRDSASRDLRAFLTPARWVAQRVLSCGATQEGFFCGGHARARVTFKAARFRARKNSLVQLRAYHCPYGLTVSNWE